MKKLLSTFALLSIFILMGACSDNRPDDLPVSVDATASESFRIIIAAGNSADGKITFTLNDFSAISDYIKWVESGEAQASSFIQLSGITSAQEVELKDVTLSLERDSKKSLSLGTMTENDKLEASNVTRLRFMQDIMDDLLRRGTSTVILRYSSTHDITTPLKLDVTINSRFSF